MKKRFLSLAVIVCMLACGVLTSCNNAPVVTAPSRKPMSMELVLISEKTIPEEDLLLVQDAINDITKRKYMTQLKLVFVPESEYYGVLDAAFAYQDEVKASLSESESIKKSSEDESRKQVQEDRKRGITQAPTRETKETVTTEETTERIVYPVIDDDKPQADIFLIRSVDEYLKLAQAVKGEDGKEITPGRLAALDEELSSSKPKILHDYIYPSFLTAPKIAGGTYCIPINHMLGEATWLAVQTDLAAMYELDTAKVTDISGMTKFFETVRAADPNAVLLNKPAPLTKYFDDIKDPAFPIASTAGTGAKTDKITIVNKYAKDSKLLSTAALNANYRELGYINESAPADTAYVAKFMTGTVADLAKWQESDPIKYDYILYEAPKATVHNTLEAAFGINASTANVTRAMEIVTLLNTSPEIKNILTYGVEGKHWIYDDNGLVQRVNDNYLMNPLYTGNQYLADIEQGQDPDIWKNAKLQNLESIASTTLAFNIDYASLKPEIKVAYTKSAEVGKKYYDRIVSGGDLKAFAQELLDNTQPAPEPKPDAEGKTPPPPPTVEEVKAAGQPVIDSGDLTKIAALIGERITAEMELSDFAAFLQAVKDTAPQPEAEAAA